MCRQKGRIALPVLEFNYNEFLRMLTIRKTGSQILSKFFRSNSIKKVVLPGVKQELGPMGA